MNTINNPLIIHAWKDYTCDPDGLYIIKYSSNKELSSGEYVDKELAKEMLTILEEIFEWLKCKTAEEYAEKQLGMLLKLPALISKTKGESL